MKHFRITFISIMVLGVFFFSAPSHAETNQIAPVVQKESGSRALAMAGAFTAISEGPFGQLYNPAGLATGKGMMFGLYQSSTESQTNEYSFAARFGVGLGQVGFLVNGANYGEISLRNDTGQLTGESLTSNEAAFYLGYGMSLDRWQVGLNLKNYIVDLGINQYKGWAADMGLLLDVGNDFMLAAVLKNLGKKDDYALPSSLRMACAVQVMESKLVVDADVDVALVDSPSEFGLGAEYRIQSWLDARLGFKTTLEQNNNAKAMLCAGIGFNFNHFSLDFNFGNRDTITREVGVALVYYLSEKRHNTSEKTGNIKQEISDKEQQQAQIEKLKKIKESAQQQAQDQESQEPSIQDKNMNQIAYHIKAGQEYEKYGQIIDAIIEYKTALKIDPNNEKAQKALQEAREKAKEQEEEKTVSSDQKEVKNDSLQKLIRKYFEKGQEAYNKKDYPEAIKQLQLVLELTNQHRQATLLLEKANQALSHEMKLLNEQAVSARQKKDLAAEIEVYRKMRDLDPRNEETRNKLKAARKKIPKEVDRLYKVGLDYYAKQNFRQALKAFEQVLQLQPAHDKAKSAVDNIKEKLIQTGQ